MQVNISNLILTASEGVQCVSDVIDFNPLCLFVFRLPPADIFPPWATAFVTPGATSVLP